MKKMFMLFVILCCLTLTSCNLGHIEDTNGESNYELSTLTKEDIFTYKSYIEVGSVNSNDGNSFRYSCKKLSGNKLIKTITPNGRRLKFDISYDIIAGNAYLVLICNDEIYKEIPPHRATTITIEGEEEYQLRILAESANVSLGVAVSEEK